MDHNSDTKPHTLQTDPVELYTQLLVALDSSDYANRGLQRAVELAKQTPNAHITGVHAYAAKLHDNRFRQMEGGLPEQFRKEAVLEEQRDVHDDLITRGLSLISDAYLDVGEEVCKQAGVAYYRRALEGKNYRELTQEMATGNHDLLVIGAQGVGAAPGETIGGVCERVVRRAIIDTMVIKNTQEESLPGPIVVAIDGSEHAYGGMLTALELAKRRGRAVILVAAYDPYYHYVVFNNINKVLSEEGAKVFKFEEQEKLHEEIIDSGLAKIYQAHLDVAKTLARDQNADVTCILLAGKPAMVIRKLLIEKNASLLVLGKTGIHADEALDIGCVTENLLRTAPCDLLITLRKHTPEVDRIASFTTTWSEEAEQRMEQVPQFVRKMARMAILRYAQEKGHTVITERIVEEATAVLMPDHAQKSMTEIVKKAEAKNAAKQPEFAPTWTQSATAMAEKISDPVTQKNSRLRAEKAARQEKSPEVLPDHLRPFMPDETKSQSGSDFSWTRAATARLEKIPEGFMRKATKKSIEAYAREVGVPREITLDITEEGIARARKHMAAKMMKDGG